MSKFGVTTISTAMLLSSFAATSSWAIDPKGVTISSDGSTEQFERAVDEAALASQEKALAQLHLLVKKYRGTDQEPVLLFKLADLQQRKSSILFRVAHATANRDLSRYKKALTSSIETLNTLIMRFPNAPEIARAYYSRGKAYEELENQAAATRDYLHLVKNFPTVEETSPAYMALAEFAIQANNHSAAIAYLKQIEKRPEEGQYPFALYKLAWSYYNLKEIPAALEYAQRQVAYFDARIAENEDQTETTSDAALRDNTLFDIPLFYFEGFEQNPSEYPNSRALSRFRKHDTSGKSLGRMMLRYAKLLRSHNHDGELVTWKDQVLSEESARPESLEVALTVYEHQLNKHEYGKLVASAQDFVKLFVETTREGRKFEAFPKARKMVLDTAEGLQALILKNKNATEVRAHSTMLAEFFSTFTRMVDAKDPRIPQVHYNLAETLFAIQDFEGATTHYRWVVENGPAQETKGTPPDSPIKAIAARYEVLKRKNLIPLELAAVSLQNDKKEDAEIEPLVKEWVEWIDALPAKNRTVEMDHFVFEANRSLYAQGHLSLALERLEAFVKAHPRSKDAIPSASLMLDTWIATADWEKTLDLANRMMKIKEWRATERADASEGETFRKRLFEAAADASYKMIEAKFNAKAYAEALKDADDFLESYDKSARTSDCLILAGNAAMALEKKNEAARYYSKLIETAKGDGKSPVALATALLSRGAIAEEKYQFTQAASDFRLYLGLPKESRSLKPDQVIALQKKTLMLLWLGGDQPGLGAALQANTVCTETLASECDRYQGLLAISSPSSLADSPEIAFERSRKGQQQENRALWAAVALQNPKELAFRDRNLMLRQLATGWKDLDPIVQFALLPHLSASVAKTLVLNRNSMKEVAPLRAHERWITRRVEVIHEMENAASKVISNLPWARIQAQAMGEIAELYIDFARGVAALPAPKDLSESDLDVYEKTVRKLVIPFEEKGQELRSKAFEIASKFAIEEDAFKTIADPFFAENPSQAKKLKPASDPGPALVLNLAALAKLDTESEWQLAALEKSGDKGDQSARVKALWAKSVLNRNWAQIAFFLQEAKQKSLLDSGRLGLVRTISLASAGAQGEALSELDEARKHLPPANHLFASNTLAQYYLRSCAQDRHKALAKEIEIANTPAISAKEADAVKKPSGS